MEIFVVILERFVRFDFENFNEISSFDIDTGKHLHGDDQRKAGGVLLGLLPKLLYYVYEAEMKFAEVGNRQRQFFTRVNFWVSPLVRTMETLALILFVLISQVQDIIDFLDNEDENNHVNLGKTNRSGNSIKDSIATIGGQFALISEESDSGSGEDDSRNMQPSQISRMQASQILVTKALGTLNQYLMEARFEIHMHLEQVSIGFANKSRFFGQGRNPFTEGNLLEGGNLLDGVGLVQEEGVVQEEGGVQEQHIVKGSSGEWFAVAWPSSSVRRGPKEPGFFESLNSATTWLKTMKAQTDEVKEYQNLTKNTTNNKTTKTEPKDLPPSLPHPANLINAGKNPKKFIRDLETAIATQNAGLVIVSTDSVWLQVLAEFVDMKSNWRAEFMSMSSSSNDEESTDAAGSNDAAESSSPGPVMRPNPNLLKHNENPQKDEKKKPCYLDHERKLKNFGVVYMTDVTVWVSESDVSDLSKVNVKEMRVLSPGIQEKEDEEEEKQHTEQSGKEDIQKEQSWKEYSQQHKDSWKEYFEQHKDLWKEYSQHKYEYQESWKEYSQHKNAELYPDNICCCLSCFLLFLFCLCLCWLKPCQLQITDNLLDKTSGVPEARLKLASENHTPLPDASSRI